MTGCRPDEAGESRGSISNIAFVDSHRRCCTLDGCARDGPTPPSRHEKDGKRFEDAPAQTTETNTLGRPRGLQERLQAVVAVGDNHHDESEQHDKRPALSRLEYGLGLEASSVGHTGLPEGPTLFAQSLAVGSGSGELGSGGVNTRVERLTGRKSTRGSHVLMFSDRARSKTHVMILSPEGGARPVMDAQGFNCDAHTVHLGRTEPDGFQVQVTQVCIMIVEPLGLNEVSSWRPPSPLKLQFGASTPGGLVAVVSEKTLIVLEINDLATGSKGKRKGGIVRELCRVELASAASSLGMRSLDKDGHGEYLDAYGPGQAPAVIAIGSWDQPLVTLFLLTTPHKSKNNAPRGPSPTALPLVEIATWCPTRRPWPTVDTLACGNVQNQGAGPGRDSVPVRAIAFVRPGGDFGCLAMVAGRADGMVAVTELQSSMYRGAGWMREADGTSWGELCTCALFQVVRGPVRFEVLPMSTEHGEEGGGGGRCGDDEAKEGGLVSRGERVLVNGYEDALVHRCSGSERSAGRQRDLWQCTPICRTDAHPRRSIVALPCAHHGALGDDASPTFAWLTTAEDPSARGEARSGVRDGGENNGTTGTDGHRHCDDAHSESYLELIVCFGSLDSESRGRWHRHPLRQTPTHLIYAPVTHSIIVACRDSGFGGFILRSGRGCGENIKITKPRCHPSVSTLRVFSADTLEERHGRPVDFRPGVAVTGLASVAVDPRTKLSFRHPAVDGSAGEGKGPNFDSSVATAAAVAAAVGGDVIAVSCCSEAGDVDCYSMRESEEAQGSEAAGNSAVTAAVTTSADSDPRSLNLVTTVAAFEVVSCCVVGQVTDEGAPPKDRASETLLMPLASSAERVGACFCLETLAEYFVAASIDDKVDVFGCVGLEDGTGCDRPAPPLTLRSVARCRTRTGGCITALATNGNFVAAAEFLQSVSLYRFDESTNVLSLLAVHRRYNPIITALALSPVGSSRGDAFDANGGFPLMAVADRATGTVAMLTCPPVPPSTSNHEQEAFSTMAEPATPGAGQPEDGKKKHNDKSQPCSPPTVLKVAFTWRSSRPETVTCLKAARLPTGCSCDDLGCPGEGEMGAASDIDASAARDAFFVFGTAEGAVRTISALNVTAPTGATTKYSGKSHGPLFTVNSMQPYEAWQCCV